MTRRQFGLGFAAVAARFAQEPAFRADVNLALLSVRVTDSRGRPVPALPQSSFQILEDGVPQRIAFFAAGRQPLSLGILLDTSGSMRESGKMEQARRAVQAMAASAGPGDEIFYIPFSTSPGEAIELPAAGAEIGARIPEAVATRSGTALYDALAMALCRLRTARHRRQALLAITDGADQHSRLQLNDVIAEVQRSSAQVYLIGYFSEEEREVYGNRDAHIVLASGRAIDNPQVAFERLAAESGAESYLPGSAEKLRRAVESVAERLETQYTLGYYRQPGVIGYRRIEVRALGGRFKTATRRGVSTAPEMIHFQGSGCAVSKADHPYPYESKLSQQNGHLAYREDFAHPRSGWPVSESCWYGSREYHVVRAGGAPNRGEPTLAAYGPWWRDVRASVSVRLAGAPARSEGVAVPGAGLVFRLNDRGYCAALMSGTGGPLHAKLVAVQFRPARAFDIVPWTPCAGPAGEWRRLEVECRGDEIAARLDGREYARVRDSRYRDGHVGMALAGAGHAVFRDLAAMELAG